MDAFRLTLCGVTLTQATILGTTGMLAYLLRLAAYLSIWAKQATMYRKKSQQRKAEQVTQVPKVRRR